jgi:hypothetical protein
MQRITSTAELKNAIQLLEVEQAINKQLVKEQFFVTVDSFKPMNLIKSSLTDISTSPYLIDNILNTAMGLAAGYFSKKIFIGESGNKFRKLIGSVLQFGAINFVAQQHDSINSVAKIFFRHILRRKEVN